MYSTQWPIYKMCTGSLSLHSKPVFQQSVLIHSGLTQQPSYMTSSSFFTLLAVLFSSRSKSRRVNQTRGLTSWADVLSRGLYKTSWADVTTTGHHEQWADVLNPIFASSDCSLSLIVSSRPDRRQDKTSWADVILMRSEQTSRALVFASSDCWLSFVSRRHKENFKSSCNKIKMKQNGEQTSSLIIWLSHSSWFQNKISALWLPLQLAIVFSSVSSQTITISTFLFD